jgi:RNA polymerase sigma-70 factor (ECF subfamily)
MSVVASLTVGRRCSVAVTPDELLAALQRGEDEAFRYVAETELNGLYLLAYRILGNRADAEDVCQEVLLRLCQAAPGLHSGTYLRAWLRRVCVNLCLNMRRHAKSRAGSDHVVEATEDLTDGLATEDAVSEVAFRAAVTEALQQLSPRQRATFVLRHFQDCSVKETADVLGCAEGTVKVQYSRAVIRLRSLLQDWGEPVGKGV